MYESAPDYTPQGAGVLININGQNALEAIDPELFERCEAAHVSFAGKGNWHCTRRTLWGQKVLQELCLCSMKAKSVSVIGSTSLNKDGSKEEFRDMKDAFTNRGSFQERYLAPRIDDLHNCLFNMVLSSPPAQVVA